MKNNKKTVIVTLVAIISLIVITVGVTYAFFNYAKIGTTDNTIKTGTITFLYTEVSGVGKGISLTEAYPVTDSIGKVQVGEGKIFDFKVTSNISMNSNIGYQVTARKKTDSTLANRAVKVYLTEVNGTEQELLLSKYSELSQTDRVDSSKFDERILYEATVPANTSNYEKNFRLRMWVSDDTDFTDGSMNDKTFTLTVNVYADGKVVNAPATKTLSQLILDSNQVIMKAPTLTTSSNNTSDASGLYKSTATNTGEPTYYFRGNVENNYVSFAEKIWRIVRINEDGTVRIVMQDGINNNTRYAFNSNNNDYIYMYYTNSEAKTQLESWYQTNIGSKSDLTKNVVSDNYYCEQAKTIVDSSWTAGNAITTQYSNYTPNFKCATDANGKGLINSSIGLITYDEIVFAGAYLGQKNSNYYLYNKYDIWTISPAGYKNSSSTAATWCVYTTGSIGEDYRAVYNLHTLRPVINLKSDTEISDGDGTKDNPFVIQ